MIEALSQVCTLPAPLARELEEYAAAGCTALELWMTKVEEHLGGNPPAEFRELLSSHNLRPVSAAFQGGLLASQGGRRAEAWELFRRRLRLAAELGVDLMIVACDVPAPLDAQAADRVQVSLAEAAALAEQAGVRVALEFQADSALGNNLQTAAGLVAAAGSPQLGLCLDAFHFHVGPSGLEDLGLLTAENLFLVQLCDLADVPRELAADQHRILPGEGGIPLGPIVQRLRDIDYQGPVTIELMNQQLWQVPPRQFAEAGLAALRACLGGE